MQSKCCFTYIDSLEAFGGWEVMDMIKKSLVAAGVSVALFLSPSVFADSVQFDPEGKGKSGFTVATWDWLPDSFVGLDAVPNPPLYQTKSFTGVAHGRLGNFLSPTSPPSVLLNTGLNTEYEITFLLKAGQKETTINANTVAFSLDGLAESAFEVYIDDQMNADPLAGTGYGDGVLLMKGTVKYVSGTFSTQALTTLLDAFTGDDWAGQQTVLGNGGSALTVALTEVNPNYFPQAARILDAQFNNSQKLEFKEIDPSKAVFGIATEGTLGATNGAAGSGPNILLQADANMVLTLEEEELGACRMTGGGVTDDGEILLDDTGSPLPIAEAQDGDGNNVNRYQFGGQIGAPTTEPAFGEWTHHQQKGPDGKFTFHAGTASAPDGTLIMTVLCSDPGFCNPARPSAFQQLDADGIGTFKNIQGKSEVGGYPVVIGESLHYFRVHFEDIGEPGPGGKQPHSPECTHVIGTEIDETETDPLKDVCANCADVYQIEIHATSASDSPVIYSVGGFIDNGNIQLHPPTGAN